MVHKVRFCIPMVEIMGVTGHGRVGLATDVFPATLR